MLQPLFQGKASRPQPKAKLRPKHRHQLPRCEPDHTPRPALSQVRQSARNINLEAAFAAAGITANGRFTRQRLDALTPTSSGSFAPLQSGAGSSATTPASACRGRRTRRRRAGSPKPLGPAVQKAQAKSAVIGREVILTKSSLSTALAKGAVRSRDHPISGAADETRTDSRPAQRQREHVMLSLCVKFPLHRTCITQRPRRPRVALHLFSHRPRRPRGSRSLLHRR